MSLSVAVLRIQPTQYMVRYPALFHGRRMAAKRGGRRGARQSRRLAGQKLYCAEIFNNGRSGTVLGASVLRGREVIFDIASSTIAFADADCDALTQATSLMRGAYAFAPCPAAAAQHSVRMNASRVAAQSPTSSAWWRPRLPWNWG